MTIGEVSDRSGIPASTLRYYESEGIIAEPMRQSGRRVYDATVLDHLLLVRSAKDAGFTVAEIRDLVKGFARRAAPGKRWQTLATQKLEEIDDRLAELHRMREILEMALSCTCPSVTDCATSIKEQRRSS